MEVSAVSLFCWEEFWVCEKGRCGTQRCHEMFRLRLIYCCKTQSLGLGVLGKYSYLWEPRTRWYDHGSVMSVFCDIFLNKGSGILLEIQWWFEQRSETTALLLCECMLMSGREPFTPLCQSKSQLFIIFLVVWLLILRLITVLKRVK